MKAEPHDKTILITGGAGSVGCALTEDLLKYNPKAIRIFDISENEMFKMKTQFCKDKRVRYLIGDIRDFNRLKLAMENVDIVIQLAAMKHVYACEYNPFEAVRTNIDGLQNVIDVARHENVEKVIYASTDKAATPTTVMGMTKLLGEKLISLANYYKGDKRTLFASVRFGNVIGSNGSVAPLFKKQAMNGGPLTITDEKMTRYIITMQEAVNLIYSAIRLTQGGETFTCNMRTLKVVDLAEVMSGEFGVGEKIQIEIVGKSEGEKLHEEIMSDEELSRTIELNNLYIILPLIDHLTIKRRYIGAKEVKNPVIISSHGSHISKQEIKKLVGSMELVA